MNCPRCDTEISEHPANRCLDALIAEKIFEDEVFDDARPVGVKSCGLTADRFYYRSEYVHPANGWPSVPKYSIFMGDAWKIVVYLTDETQRFELITGHQDIAWIVGEKSGPKLGLYVCGVGDTMPLAICRVALKATANEL